MQTSIGLYNNKFAQSNLGRGCVAMVADPPIAAAHNKPQLRRFMYTATHSANSPLVTMWRPIFAPKLPLSRGPIPKPKFQLPASSLDSSDLHVPSRTASISDQPFCTGQTDRQTHTPTQTNRWSEEMFTDYWPSSLYRGATTRPNKTQRSPPCHRSLSFD